MISRVRIEVRAASMEEAEREAETLIHHANIAGYLEGIAPQSSRMTDHHFGAFLGTGQEDRWAALGLGYEGRIAMTYEPEPNPGGGLKQYSYRVIEDESGVPEELRDGKPDEDVTERMMVLERHRPVLREHSWEVTPMALMASAEDVLDNIRRLVNVEDVEVSYDRTQRDGSGWRVNVTFKPDSPHMVPMTLSVGKETLREAALEAYGGCGVEVMHFDTEASEPEPKHSVTYSFAELNVPTATKALVLHPYRTLVVGSETGVQIGREVLDMLIRMGVTRAKGVAVRWDENHSPHEWTLTTEAVEPMSEEARLLAG